MSLSIFFQELQKEDLTLQTLENAFHKTDLVNKSPIINIAKNSFVKKLDTLKEKGIDRIPQSEIKSLCDTFRYKLVQMKMQKKRVEPMLEEKIIGGKSYSIDVPTSILFEQMGDHLVATHVYIQETEYKLRTKHLDICLSKGWYFQTDIPEYQSCPLRYENIRE